MQIKGLMIDPVSNMPIIVLRDAESGLSFPSGSASSRPTPSP